MQEDYSVESYTQEELELASMGVRIVSLSDLSKEDYRLFQMNWEEYRLKSVKEFVTLNFLDISKIWDEKRRQGILGLIELAARNPNDLDCGGWSYRFAQNNEITDDQKVLSALQSTSLKEPNTMGVMFYETHAQQYPFSFGDPCYTYVNVDQVLCLPSVFHVSPDTSSVISEKNNRAQKPVKQQPEQRLEDELYDWLRVKGVDVERQVTTAKHRLDLWIPSKAMLELKQGRVSGDDVCQAIDYAATYQMPIVLVGTGLSSGASRGIDGFNRAMGKDLIIFVTWGGVRTYLNGAFNLK